MTAADICTCPRHAQQCKTLLRSILGMIAIHGSASRQSHRDDVRYTGLGFRACGSSILVSFLVVQLLTWEVFKIAFPQTLRRTWFGAHEL